MQAYCDKWLAVTRVALAAAAVSAMIWLPSSLAAADPAAKPPERATDAAEKKPSGSALDDALLKDLDNELLEGAGDLKAGPKPKPASADGPGEPSPAPPGEAGEDIGTPGENEDPLGRISQEMRAAEDYIRELTKRNSAEKMQRRIVDDLAGLIEQVEKQAAQQSSSSSKEKKSQKTGKRQMVQQPKSGQSRNNSNNPAKDSTDRLGKAEAAKPDPRALKEMAKDSWGHLPPHEREQMSQNWPERFLPQYELMIERYYKRLAEEQGSR
jgi:hypothetical protein